MKELFTIILFYAGIICSYSQSAIEGYEYWFNDDYANKTTTTVTPTQRLLINQNIPGNGLIGGINILNFRSFDNSGKYSSIVSHYFYKKSMPENNSSPEIVAYEYWLDTDYENAVAVSTPVQQQVNINELISMSSLKNGVHNFNIRFKDNTNLWSTVVSHFFYKTPERIVTQNMITEYRYWMNNDFANVKNVRLTVAQQVNVTNNLDLTQLAKGNHEIHFQFKDTLGMWSAVMVDTIQKVSFPVADFTYSITATCDSTLISFTDNSIDGDTYFWDFGDGNADSIANPTHIYYTPDTYQVSLTVTDTLLGKDSTITINVTIENFDSSVTQNGITLIANNAEADYQWLDCNNGYLVINGETNQTFTATQNGSYAVEVSQNGCVDTSACYTVTNVGIVENSFDTNITIYPNPTDGIVNVDLGEILTEFTVKINDISGKTISHSTCKNTGMVEINLNVQPGIYLMVIKSGNKKATIRLIKN